MKKSEFESSEGITYTGASESKGGCKCGGNCQCKSQKEDHACECGGSCNCR